MSLQVLHVLRTLEYKADNERIVVLHKMIERIRQEPYASPSVFNFYLPEYQPHGRCVQIKIGLVWVLAILRSSGVCVCSWFCPCIRVCDLYVCLIGSLFFHSFLAQPKHFLVSSESGCSWVWLPFQLCHLPIQAQLAPRDCTLRKRNCQHHH